MVAAVLKELNSGGVGIARNDNFLKLQNYVCRYTNGLSTRGMGMYHAGYFEVYAKRTGDRETGMVRVS